MSHPTLYGVLDAEKKQNQLHQAALLAQVDIPVQNSAPKFNPKLAKNEHK